MDNIGKMYSQDAEESVLGCLLLDNSLCLQYVGKISEDDFYINDAKIVFRAIALCFDKGVAVDVASVSNRFSDSDRERLSSFSVNCALRVPTVKMMEGYFAALKEMSKRRNLYQSLMNAVGAISSGEAADDVSAKLFADLSQKVSVLSGASMRDAVMEFYDDVGKRYSLAGELFGIATGFSRLDALLGGMQRGEMIVLGARPSVGKSAFVGAVFMDVLLRQKLPGLFFSYEMPRVQIMRRMVSGIAQVKNMDMRMGNLSPKDFEKIAAAAEIISPAIGEIYEDYPNFSEVRYRAANFRAQKGDLGLIIIDYLQLMPGKGRDSREIVEKNSRMIKLLAKELNCAILVLSQLSRAVEGRASSEPYLSDLRETGAIEQDADVVLLLYEDGDQRKIKVAKARDGDLGTVPVLFLKDYCLFCEPREKKKEEDSPKPEQGTEEKAGTDKSVPYQNKEQFKEVEGEEISFPEL